MLDDLHRVITLHFWQARGDNTAFLALVHTRRTDIRTTYEPMHTSTDVRADEQDDVKKMFRHTLIEPIKIL